MSSVRNLLYESYVELVRHCIIIVLLQCLASCYKDGVRNRSLYLRLRLRFFVSGLPFYDLPFLSLALKSTATLFPLFLRVGEVRLTCSAVSNTLTEPWLQRVLAPQLIHTPNLRQQVL